MSVSIQSSPVQETLEPISNRAYWCGPNYGTSKCRILLVGESNYSTNASPNAQTLTSDVIEEHLDRSCRIPFYTKIANAFCNRSCDDNEQIEFWNGVAFHNYLPGILQRPREKVHALSVWAAGKQPFDAAILTLAPTHILVLGTRLWSWMAELHEHIDSAVRPGETAALPYGNGQTAQLMYIRHPSSFGFRWQDWAAQIDTFRQSVPE